LFDDDKRATSTYLSAMAVTRDSQSSMCWAEPEKNSREEKKKEFRRTSQNY